ncbi:alpha/beta hydrolase [Acidiferrobacter thiooxydans]|uniref:Alpha/beta hydrolase n=2 Tax=Acidiferrobacter thiooxydans TaxID=163359 RepID=A0A1C2G0X1_9GAMM|nr:alpha/beta hydrolase [Acidiferrobacter thiooxydans]
MITMGTRSRMTLADGRVLAYADCGPSSGMPVVYCHGFPSSAREADLLVPVLAAEGVRLIAPDRPGYGASSPQTGRSLGGFADDVAALLDHLGVAKAAVIGVSGGGPYALSLLARLPERLGPGALVAGLGPPSAQVSCRTDFFPIARWALYVIGIAPVLAPLLARPAVHALRLRGRLQLGLRLTAPADREVLADPAVLDILVGAQHAGLIQGGYAAVQDLLLYVRPWDVSLAAIRAPCTLWHGTCDRIVPAAVAVALAGALPTARLRLIPGEGHYSLPIRHRGPILRELIASAHWS